MNTPKSTLFLVAACCLGLAPGALSSADDKNDEGWISLFNGKDLTGWKASEEVEWTVEDGTIKTPPQRSHLFTDEEFKNFEYKVDCKTTPGSNSGLYIHTKYQDTFPDAGYEVQVNQTQGDPVKSGSLYNVVKLYSTPVKDGEWYTYHITVQGKQITVRINDKVLYQYVEPEGVTGPRKLSKGSFAIQAHDPKSVAYYKNIKVKPLPDQRRTMKLGYNTNGLAFHRWPEALELLADLGYQSVAITLDHHCLDPYADGLAQEVARTAGLLGRLKLDTVVETGARFLLDPRVKHEPTLMSATAEERARRIDFLKRAIDIARDLGSDAVSFWSGILREPIPRDAALARLAAGCAEVLEHAEFRKMKLGFEPEPGMFIESFAQFGELLQRVDSPLFGLTIDIGHVHCVEEGPIAGYLRQWAPRLVNVHIEDMRKGIHEHLRFGEGEIDFAPVMRTLAEIGYTGGVHVELSRHSHIAPAVVGESIEFLRGLSPP